MFVKVMIAFTTAVTVLTLDCVQCNDLSPETTITVELEIEEILGDDPTFGNNSVELNGTENPDLNQTTQTTLVTSTPTTIPSLVTIGYVPDDYCEQDSACALGNICVTNRCIEGCRNDANCRFAESCINRMCQNPCNLFGACGLNAVCKPLNHHRICTCIPEYTGDSKVLCERILPPPECTIDSQCPLEHTCQNQRCSHGCRTSINCPPDKACVRSKCANPCNHSGACGKEAICAPANHVAICNCPSGFIGDPDVECREIPPECRNDEDCGLGRICLKQKCIVTRPLDCNHNQVESQCVNTCEPTCDEPDKSRCKNRWGCQRGCECKPGYVRDRRNWSCIAKEECPKCATNEHYRHCWQDCLPNCENYQNFNPHCDDYRHIDNCVSGCFCDYGFVRDESRNGTCVLPSECPQKCGPNEYYDNSGKPCVRTFADPQPKCLDMKPEPTCVCNTGFVRNPRTKICEPHSNLENCGANQTFSYCGSTCAEKCFEYSNRRAMCPTTCLRGCFCKPGYFKDSISNQCVLQEDCVGKYY